MSAIKLGCLRSGLGLRHDADDLFTGKFLVSQAETGA